MFPSRYKYGYFSRVRKYNPLVINALSFSLLILRYGWSSQIYIGYLYVLLSVSTER